MSALVLRIRKRAVPQHGERAGGQGQGSALPEVEFRGQERDLPLVRHESGRQIYLWKTLWSLFAALPCVAAAFSARATNVLVLSGLVLVLPFENPGFV